MIKSFRHKGLRRFFETGSTSGIQASHAKRLADVARRFGDGADDRRHGHPGLSSASAQGDLDGRWSVTVSGNWRMTFEFRDGNAYVVDYEDYH